MRLCLRVVGLLLVLCGIDANAFEPYRFIEITRLPDLNWGADSSMINTMGVDHVLVDDANTVYAWDKYDGQLVLMSLSDGGTTKYQLETEYPFASQYMFAGRNGLTVITEEFLGAHVLSCDLESSLTIRFDDYGVPNTRFARRSVFVGNALFVKAGHPGAFHSFVLSQDDDHLQYIYRDPAETRVQIEEGNDPWDGFWYDDDGYLFYGERLVTPDPRVFDAYFSQFDLYDDAGGVSSSSDSRLLGVDRDGNYYWVNPLFLSVHSPDGEPIAEIQFDLLPQMGRLQIDPDGNIYTLSYGGIVPGELSLLWIERDW